MAPSDAWGSGSESSGEPPESKAAIVAMTLAIAVVVVLLGMVLMSPTGDGDPEEDGIASAPAAMEVDPVAAPSAEAAQPLPPAGSDAANKLLKEKLKALIRHQLPKAPVIPKNPLVESDLATMLSEAEQYSQAYPTNFQNIIARYDQLARQAAGTPEEEAIKRTRGDWELRFFAADALALDEFKAKVEECFFNRRPHECFTIWEGFPTNLLSEAILDEAAEQIVGARGPFITEVALGQLRGISVPPELRIPVELIPDGGVNFGALGTMRGGFPGPGSQGGLRGPGRGPQGGVGGQRGPGPGQFGGGNNTRGPGPGGRAGARPEVP